MQLFYGINVVSISVTDLGRARLFCGETLGRGEPLYDLPEEGWLEFSAGAPAANLAVTLAGPDWEPSTGTTVVLNVRVCYAAVDDLRCRGIACGEPVVFDGHVVFASFHDPFGNRLQMCSNLS